MRIAVLALVLAAACGAPLPLQDPRFDLDQPLHFEVTPELASALEERGLVANLDRALVHASAILGTRIGPSVNRTIPLHFGSAQCDDGHAGAHASGFTGIVFCAAGLYPDFPLLQWNLMHELGHVLGAGHLSCDVRAFMSAPCSVPVDLIEPPDVVTYAPEDLAEICRLAYGGICRR